jgi:hypothetical protein
MAISDRVRTLVRHRLAGGRRVGMIGAALAALLIAPVAAGAQTLATYQIGSGWATFGLALPKGAVSTGVKVGQLPTQTDIKTRWADGSIRFAVVTANVSSGGSFAITPAAASTGSFAPTWPQASVRFSIAGTNYIADLPAYNPANSWLFNGPLVRESRVLVSPTSNGTPHPLLQVVYDIRSYSGGGHRVDITVQNTKDITAGNLVAFDVTISIGGATVYSKNGVTQNYLTRWRKVFLTGGLTEAEVTPDFEPFYQARALPRYDSHVKNQAYGGVTDPKYDILGFGDMASYMGMPGGRPEIAPYPNWQAQYLIHKRPDQRAYMLKHADLSGSWTGHITKADGVALPNLDEMPNYWLDGRAGTNPNGPNATRKPDGFLNGWGEALENAHMPSLTFVPYIVTGDRFYLDQQKFWGNYAILSTWPGDPKREGGKGVLYPNQTRGVAWGLRVLGECAAYMPDDDPELVYFRTRVNNNLEWLARYATDTNGGPFAVTFFEKYVGDGKVSTSTWQLAYLAYAVDRLIQHGFNAGGEFRDRVGRFQTRLFTSNPEYPPIYGAPYYLQVGTESGGNVSLYTSMAQIFAVNYNNGSSPPQPFTGYYGPETWILLQIAVAQGIPGADQALAFLISQPGVLDDAYNRSGWALLANSIPGSGVGSTPAPSAPRNVHIVP